MMMIMMVISNALLIVLCNTHHHLAGMPASQALHFEGWAWVEGGGGGEGLIKAHE
jgi:hypothetical protein